MFQSQEGKSLNIKKNKIFNLNFLLVLLVFFFPLSNFVGNNLDQLPVKNIIQILIYNFFLLIIFITINILLNKKFKNINFLTFFVIFFWLSFQYQNIRDLISKISLDFASEITLIILLIVIFLIIFFYKKKKEILLKFLVIFFLIQYGNLSLQIYNSNSYENQNLAVNDISQSLKVKEFSEIKKRNIYYVIVDEMTSLREFQSMFGKNIANFDYYYQSKDFHYLDDYSSFNLTTLTLASILNLDRIVKVGDNISNYNHNKILFPKNLRSINFQTYNQPNLIKILENFEYDFFWIGNNWGDCINFNEKLCLNYSSKKKKKNLINFTIMYHFLKPTPFELILRKINQYTVSDVEGYISGNDFKHNDAIGKFLNSGFSSKKQKNHFILIHHFSPHKPYIFNSDCSYDASIKIDLSQELEGYKNNYLCTLKKIKKLINFINDIDPQSVLVIQGDHGFKNDDNFIELKDKEKFKIFNLIKTPEKCENIYKNRLFLGNINTARVAINCALGIKLDLIENFPVYSNKENKKFGEVKKFPMN